MIRKVKNFVHFLIAMLANFIYGFPGRKLKIIGVTGTDGKTTTTSLIYHILQTAGHKTAMITTVGAYINGKEQSTGFHVTTPSAFTIQRFLKEALSSGHEYVVIETSSHGIDQNRIWGINYQVAAITNITHEHLDYHGTFNAYTETKLKFLQSAKIAVINIDDKTIASFKNKLLNKVITYSRTQNADFNLNNYSFETKLLGEFNQSNCLAAIASCKQVGISDDFIRQSLKTFAAPAGRQEIIYDHDFKIMVDFAHTPNSIENLLRAVKQTNPKRLIHVFGAPGRRDESKRPLMGESSSKYADIMVITSDDPRDEKISDIMKAVRNGVKGNFTEGQNLFEIENRREAIKFALQNAQSGDYIVLGGKGHEPTLALADQELPWNEKRVALEILEEIKKS